MSVRSVGIEVGSSSTVMMADDGDIVLTSTGSIARPTMVAFNGKSRCIDEEASALSNAATIVKSFNLFNEQKLDSSIARSNSSVSSDEKGRVSSLVKYNDDEKEMSMSAIFGMFLAKQSARISDVYSEPEPKLAFVLPPNSTTAAATTIMQACSVAGIDLSRVCTVDKAECLKIAYTRKLHALQPNERTHLEGRKVVLIDMGHTQTTAMLLDAGSSLDAKTTPLFSEGGPKVLKTAYDADLGAAHFDAVIFDHLAEICKAKHATEVAPGSRRAKRLTAGCERIRKLLSQLPEGSTTIENLTDNGDISFKLTRDEFTSLAAPLLARLKKLLVDDLLAGMSARDITEVGGVECVGGGSRMLVVQSVICEIFRDNKHINNTTGPGTTKDSPITSSKRLGAKLDDGSVALGAALISNNILDSDNKMPGGSSSNSAFVEHGQLTAATGDVGAAAGVTGYTTDEVAAMAAAEIAMQKQDSEIEQLLAARNDMEAYLLDCRGFKRQKYGTAEYLDVAVLDTIVDENENWMYDEYEAPLEDVQAKFAGLKQKVEQLCEKYFAAIAADKKRVEEELKVQAEKAAAEKAENGEGEEDHDNRKLKKAERMRMVVKNKEEATEIFKGGVYKTACARYSKALSHCSKFFDLDAAGEKEVLEMKVTLYLNIALCYSKMNNPDQVLSNCNHALKLDANSPKAYFRRSGAWEAKKDLDKALEDAKTAQFESAVPDKAINQTVSRLTKAIAKQKETEKKMWKGAFN